MPSFFSDFSASTANDLHHNANYQIPSYSRARWLTFFAELSAKLTHHNIFVVLDGCELLKRLLLSRLSIAALLQEGDTLQQLVDVLVGGMRSECSLVPSLSLNQELLLAQLDTLRTIVHLCLSLYGEGQPHALARDGSEAEAEADEGDEKKNLKHTDPPEGATQSPTPTTEEAYYQLLVLARAGYIVNGLLQLLRRCHVHTFGWTAHLLSQLLDLPLGVIPKGMMAFGVASSPNHPVGGAGEHRHPITAPLPMGLKTHCEALCRAVNQQDHLLREMVQVLTAMQRTTEGSPQVVVKHLLQKATRREKVLLGVRRRAQQQQQQQQPRGNGRRYCSPANNTRGTESSLPRSTAQGRGIVEDTTGVFFPPPPDFQNIASCSSSCSSSSRAVHSKTRVRQYDDEEDDDDDDDRERGGSSAAVDASVTINLSGMAPHETEEEATRAAAAAAEGIQKKKKKKKKTPILAESDTGDLREKKHEGEDGEDVIPVHLCAKALLDIGKSASHDEFFTRFNIIWCFTVASPRSLLQAFTPAVWSRGMGRYLRAAPVTRQDRSVFVMTLNWLGEMVARYRAVQPGTRDALAELAGSTLLPFIQLDRERRQEWAASSATPAATTTGDPTRPRGATTTGSSSSHGPVHSHPTAASTGNNRQSTAPRFSTADAAAEVEDRHRWQQMRASPSPSSDRRRAMSQEGVAHAATSSDATQWKTWETEEDRPALLPHSIALQNSQRIEREVPSIATPILSVLLAMLRSLTAAQLVSWVQDGGAFLLLARLIHQVAEVRSARVEVSVGASSTATMTNGSLSDETYLHSALESVQSDATTVAVLACKLLVGMLWMHQPVLRERLLPECQVVIQHLAPVLLQIGLQNPTLSIAAEDSAASLHGIPSVRSQAVFQRGGGAATIGLSALYYTTSDYRAARYTSLGECALIAFDTCLWFSHTTQLPPALPLAQLFPLLPALSHCTRTSIHPALRAMYYRTLTHLCRTTTHLRVVANEVPSALHAAVASVLLYRPDSSAAPLEAAAAADWLSRLLAIASEDPELDAVLDFSKTALPIKLLDLVACGRVSHLTASMLRLGIAVGEQQMRLRQRRYAKSRDGERLPPPPPAATVGMDAKQASTGAAASPTSGLPAHQEDDNHDDGEKVPEPFVWLPLGRRSMASWRRILRLAIRSNERLARVFSYARRHASGRHVDVDNDLFGTCTSSSSGVGAAGRDHGAPNPGPRTVTFTTSSMADGLGKAMGAIEFVAVQLSFSCGVLRALHDLWVVPRQPWGAYWWSGATCASDPKGSSKPGSSEMNHNTFDPPHSSQQQAGASNSAVVPFSSILSPSASFTSWYRYVVRQGDVLMGSGVHGGDKSAHPSSSSTYPNGRSQEDREEDSNSAQEFFLLMHRLLLSVFALPTPTQVLSFFSDCFGCQRIHYHPSLPSAHHDVWQWACTFGTRFMDASRVELKLCGAPLLSTMTGSTGRGLPLNPAERSSGVALREEMLLALEQYNHHEDDSATKQPQQKGKEEANSMEPEAKEQGRWSLLVDRLAVHYTHFLARAMRSSDIPLVTRGYIAPLVSALILQNSGAAAAGGTTSHTLLGKREDRDDDSEEEEEDGGGDGEELPSGLLAASRSAEMMKSTIVLEGALRAQWDSAGQRQDEDGHQRETAITAERRKGAEGCALDDAGMKHPSSAESLFLMEGYLSGLHALQCRLLRGFQPACETIWRQCLGGDNGIKPLDDDAEGKPEHPSWLCMHLTALEQVIDGLYQLQDGSRRRSTPYTSRTGVVSMGIDGMSSASLTTEQRLRSAYLLELSLLGNAFGSPYSDFGVHPAVSSSTMSSSSSSASGIHQRMAVCLAEGLRMDMVRTETLQALVPLSHTSQGRALLQWEITAPGGGDALARSVFGRVLAITLSMPIVWGGGVGGAAACSSAVAGPYRRGHGGAAATMVAVVPPPAPTGAAANLSTRAQVLMGYEICAIVAAVDAPQEEAGDKKGLVERGDGMGGVAVDRKTCSAKTLEETNTTSTTTTAVPASSSKSVARDGFTNPFLALMVKHKALERLCQRLEDGDDAQRNRPRREYFTVEWMYTLRCLAVMSVQPEVQRLVFQRSKTMQILLEHASGLYWYRYRETATSTATGHTGASLASAHRVDAATAAQQASTLALLILHHLCFLPRLKTSICQDTRFLFTLKAAVLGYHGAAPLLLDPAAMAAMTSGGGGSLHTSMTVKHSSSLSGNHNAHNVLPFTPALLDILAQPHQSIMQQGGAVTASRALSTLFSPTSTSILGTVSQRPSMMEAGYDRRSTPLLDWAQRWRVEVSETETTLASGIVLSSSSSGSRADQRRCEWAPSVLCLSDTRERVRRQDLALSALWSLLYDHQKGKFYIRRLLFPDRSAVVAWDSVCNDARRMAASTASTEYTNKKCNKKNKKAGVGDQIESTQPQDQRCPCMPCTAPPSAAAYTDCSCKDEQERMNAHILQCVESVQFLLRDAE